MVSNGTIRVTAAFASSKLCHGLLTSVASVGSSATQPVRAMTAMQAAHRRSPCRRNAVAANAIAYRAVADNAASDPGSSLHEERLAGLAAGQPGQPAEPLSGPGWGQCPDRCLPLRDDGSSLVMLRVLAFGGDDVVELGLQYSQQELHVAVPARLSESSPRIVQRAGHPAQRHLSFLPSLDVARDMGTRAVEFSTGLVMRGVRFSATGLPCRHRRSLIHAATQTLESFGLAGPLALQELQDLQDMFGLNGTDIHLAQQRAILALAAQQGAPMPGGPFLLAPGRVEQGSTQGPFLPYPHKLRYMSRDRRRRSVCSARRPSSHGADLSGVTTDWRMRWRGQQRMDPGYLGTSSCRFTACASTCLGANHQLRSWPSLQAGNWSF